MKKFVIASLALVAFAAPAIAADMPVKAPMMVAPVYNWSGFYVGINGGGGWGSSRWDFAVGTTTGNYKTSGGLVGGTIGYNWQFGAWVLGLEGDLDWTNIKGSTPCPNPAFTCQTGNSWLATARGRVGYAANNWLFYATGGGAWGDVKADLPVNPLAPALPGQTSTRSGWAAGGGVEYGINRNWSVKAEYLYVSLGNMVCTVPNCATGSGNVTVPFNVNTARLGLNYRF